MTARVALVSAGAWFLLCMASTTRADENADAMVMRIEPADKGVAKVLRDGRSEEVAFMMPLYKGDTLHVESPNTTVQVRVFGGDDLFARTGEPLTIGADAQERTIFSSMLGALSEKVFRNNQMSRRNLVTRSDGEPPGLALHGFGVDGSAQALVAGQRSLLLRWNRDLDSVTYRLEEAATRRVLATGTAEGDFAFVDDIDIADGDDYVVLIEDANGSVARGAIAGVAALPPLTPVDQRLGAAGAALRLVELASLDGGRWKFEAIQGVPDLSADDIDRATLIAEIAAL